MNKLVLVTCLSVCLTACSSVANFNRYVITSDVVNYDINNKYDVTVGIATFLDSNGVVMQTSEVSYAQAVNNKWAEPITDQILTVIEDKFLIAKIEEKFKYNFFISKFNGKTDGTVHTALQVSVYNDKKHIFDYSKSLSNDMTGDGYESLVSDLKINLNYILNDFIGVLKSRKGA